jgi:hypothetical protein
MHALYISELKAHGNRPKPRKSRKSHEKHARQTPPFRMLLRASSNPEHPAPDRPNVIISL